MAYYSIRQLEERSGIKASTLRAWETRYGLLQPRRTAANVRYYDDKDLHLVQRIAALRRSGLKMAQIAAMPPQEMTDHISRLNIHHTGKQDLQDELIQAMIAIDEPRFHRLIDRYTTLHGFEACMYELIYPFLDKLNILWLTDTIDPTQELFAGYIIRQKLLVAIENLALSRPSQGKKYIVYKPLGSQQELTLLFAQYMLRAYGHQVFYLGLGITVDQLKSASRRYQPDGLFTIITESFKKEPASQYLLRLTRELPGKEIVVFSDQRIAQKAREMEAVRLLSDIHTFRDWLRL